MTVRRSYTECMDRLRVALRSAARVGSRRYVSGLLIGTRTVASMGIRTHRWSR
jgi:hypothetical protein